MERRYVVTPRRERVWRGLARGVRDVLAGPSTWSSAWVIAWTTMALGISLRDSLESTGTPEDRVIGATFVVGVVGGIVWQWLYRRDLVERFSAIALFGIVVVIAVLLLPGDGESIDSRGAATAFGLLAGNVVLEWWLRLPRQRERYEDRAQEPA